MTRKEDTTVTRMTWTLDAEGRLSVTWVKEPAPKPAAKAAVPPTRFRRAVRAAYSRLQTSLTRRDAA